MINVGTEGGDSKQFIFQMAASSCPPKATINENLIFMQGNNINYLE